MAETQSIMSAMRLGKHAPRLGMATPILVMVLIVTACDPSVSKPFEQDRLEQIEDLSESLANDLLELSVAVRDRQEAEIGRFFADSIEQGAPWPIAAGSLAPEVKWIHRHGWRSPEAPEYKTPSLSTTAATTPGAPPPDTPLSRTASSSACIPTTFSMPTEPPKRQASSALGRT